MTTKNASARERTHYFLQPSPEGAGRQPVEQKQQSGQQNQKFMDLKDPAVLDAPENDSEDGREEQYSIQHCAGVKDQPSHGQIAVKKC